MIRVVVSLCVMASAAAASVTGAMSPEEIANRCVSSIQRIHSYDVLLKIDQSTFTDPDLTGRLVPTVVSSHQIRDALATGFGRRVDHDMTSESDRIIAVKKWNQAIVDQKVLSSLLSYGHPGSEYFTYFNPNCYLRSKGDLGLMDVPPARFLVDILQDPSTTIVATDPPTKGDSLGILVDNTALMGPIAVWCNRSHGYLPDNVQMFTRMTTTNQSTRDTPQQTQAADTLYLNAIIQIDEYVEIAPGAWAPLQGTYSDVTQSSDMTDREWFRTALLVDSAESSWNHIHSSDLFEETSLPIANHERNGWREYIGPQRLTRTREADVQLEALAKPQLSHSINSFRTTIL
jgi:hypothetical protein